MNSRCGGGDSVIRRMVFPSCVTGICWSAGMGAAIAPKICWEENSSAEATVEDSARSPQPQSWEGFSWFWVEDKGDSSVGQQAWEVDSPDEAGTSAKQQQTGLATASMAQNAMIALPTFIGFI